MTNKYVRTRFLMSLILISRSICLNAYAYVTYQLHGCKYPWKDIKFHANAIFIKASMTSLLWTYVIQFYSITVDALNKQPGPREELGGDLQIPRQSADQWSSWWWPRARASTVCSCWGTQSREEDKEIEKQSTEAHDHLPFSPSLRNIICTQEQTKQYPTWHRPRMNNFD